VRFLIWSPFADEGQGQKLASNFPYLSVWHLIGSFLVNKTSSLYLEELADR